VSGKLYIRTFGCQMNEYDSARMADVLREEQGLTLTDDPEQADVVLINTCSVREKPQEKLFSELGRYKALKRKRPGMKIGVGGCVASQEGAAIGARAPYVDVIFGPQTLHRLPKLLGQSGSGGGPVVDLAFPAEEKFASLPAPRAASPVANLSVMEGCSKFCSFCVVPYTRGEEISRPVADVLSEAIQLERQGVREINLLGQNVNGYRGAAPSPRTSSWDFRARPRRNSRRPWLWWRTSASISLSASCTAQGPARPPAIWTIRFRSRSSSSACSACRR